VFLPNKSNDVLGNGESERERERKEPHLLEKNVSGKISHKCSHIEYWRSVKEAGSVTDRE
jgi:hypothetical protein